MATEFEELRLSITLIDDASAGIKAIRAEMRGTTGSAADYQKLIRDNTKSARVYGDVVGYVDGRLVLLGGSVGFLSSKIDRIGGSIGSQVSTLTEFARQQQQANQVAQLLGMSIGHLKSIRSQAQRTGISDEDADKIASGATALLYKLSHQGGRADFQKMLMGSHFSVDNTAYTARLSKAKDYAEVFNIASEERRNQERELISKGMDPELAKRAGIEWMILHGLPAVSVAMEELRLPTREYLAEQQRRVDVAEAWLKQVVKLDQNVQHIKGKILVALGPGTKFYEGMQEAVKVSEWLAKNAETWFWLTLLVSLGTPWGLALFLRQMQKEGFGKLYDLLLPKKQKLSVEVEELGDQIQRINLVMTPAGTGIVPASFQGLGGLPGWLQTPGGTGPGSPTPGTGASTGGGQNPRSPGGGEGAPKTPGVDTGGTPGTPTGQPTITPQKALPPGVLYNPITGKYIRGVGGPGTSATVGSGHQGEDWGAPVGTPVYAVRDGTIVRVGTDNFGQPTATIDHGDGTFTRDLHLQPGSVPPVGTKVYGGQPYARSGSANNVPHLHHERWLGDPRRGGRIINPSEESGRDPKKPMTGGELAPRSAQPGESRAAPETPVTPPAPDTSTPETPDKTAPEGGFSPIPPGGLPKLSTPEVPTAPETGGGPAGRENIPTTSRSPKLDTTNPAIRDALRIPRLPGESDEAWTARGRKALERARSAPRSAPGIAPKLPAVPEAPILPPLGEGRFRSGARGPIKLPQPGGESADEAITRRIQEMKAASGLSTRPPAGTPANEVESRFPKSGEQFDRSVIDKSLQNEISAKVNGAAKVDVDVSKPDKETGDTPKDLFKKDTVERQDNMGDSEKGPSVEVD